MKKVIFLALPLILFLGVWVSAGDGAQPSETLHSLAFGDVLIFKPSGPVATSVVLLISGDGGWRGGVVHVVQTLRENNALVAGIDIRRYFNFLKRGDSPCSYPAGDLETLSKLVQKQQNLPNYLQPILMGYSSGATLAYAAFAEAPPNTFAAALTFGFCPDLALRKPFCKGYGLDWTKNPGGKGLSFLPAKNLRQPWITFQGVSDQVCNPDATRSYVEQVPNGQFVELPKVGHGFAAIRNWLTQFKEILGKLNRTSTRPAAEAPKPEAHVSDLPLIELPVNGKRDVLAVIITGDGGWASIDRDVGNYLANKGIPVVGLDSLRYFWSPRTPESAAGDLNRIVTHYLDSWKKSSAMLIGYSLGADVLPSMIRNLPASTMKHVTSIVLLGPTTRADFEFHFTDWLGDLGPKRGDPVLPNLLKIGGPKILLVCGAGEDDSLCHQMKTDKVTRSDIQILLLGGGHHFGGDYKEVAEMITRRLSIE